MNHPRLAERYAKSLVGLATERQQLEVVYKDMEYLLAVCKSSRELISLLKSPVIKADKKQKILAALANGKVSELTAQFIQLLVRKRREENLPEIAESFIILYNRIKEIHIIQLTTAHAIGEELKQSIIAQIKSNTRLKNIELETKVDDALIGGYLLEFNNILIDESIARDLRDIRAQFNKNIYVRQIR
jgi:F-type H+-transporting ATPase subunit delta